jgi:hypothetical protein
VARNSVRLQDQGAFPVENDIDWRGRDATERQRFDVVADKACDSQHERLMGNERRRRLAGDAHRHSRIPVRLVRVVELCVRRHNRSSTTSMASSAR